MITIACHVLYVGVPQRLHVWPTPTCKSYV